MSKFRAVGCGRSHLYQPLEDWFKVFQFSVMKRVDAETALQGVSKWSTRISRLDLVRTGNLHLASHSALTEPKWGYF